MTDEPRKGADGPEPLGTPPAPELLFCAVCHVSITAAEVASGEARTTPRGRTFCATCARATPEERARRRAVLEAEFADDAPVPLPVSDATHPTAQTRPSAQSAGPGDPMLEARVGELERTVFRLRARVTFLEERLQEMLQHLT